jgi:hypothetical protein
MGRALVLALVALIVVALEVEADEICVEAAAPVMARTTMKARTIFFMVGLPLKLYLRLKIFLDKPDETTIGCNSV